MTRRLPRPMPWRYRAPLYAAFAVLWLSGMGWWLLDACCAAPGEFGPSPHPWQPGILLAHGVASIPTLYAIGWISARHAAVNWNASFRRFSGGIFSTVLAILCVSGFTLFFVSADSAQQISRICHEIAGCAFTLVAAEHWSRSRRDRPTVRRDRRR